MPAVYRILMMNFDKPSCFVENFLPETDRSFFSINHLQVSGSPTEFASDIERIQAAAVRPCFPRAEFAFVLRASRHRFGRSRGVDSAMPGKCT